MTGGMRTLWGVALIRQRLDEGVFWIKTMTGGGLLIEKARADQLLSEKARRIGQTWYDFLAFDEEQAIMVVFYEYPELYPWVEAELTEKLAEDALHQSYPEYFAS
jgi:hypothetical protein